MTVKPKQLTMPTFLWATNPKEIDSERFIYSPPYASLILVADRDKYKKLMLNPNVIRKDFRCFEKEYTFALWKNNVEMAGGHLAPEISTADFLTKAFNWSLDFLTGYEFEAGYTPRNLRLLIGETGLSQPAFAKKHDIALPTLRKWLLPVDSGNHRDMPLWRWLELLKKIEQSKINALHIPKIGI